MSTISRTDLTRETSAEGSFVRQRSAFRDWVSADGSTGYRAEPGRYHLYVSLACPWAHRTIIVRKLKGLEHVISLSVVDPLRDERGWRFGTGAGSDGEPDPVGDRAFLSEAYFATDPAFEGRVTTPTLFDRDAGRVVSNESADILRMLNTEFDEWGDASVDLYPLELRPEIDALNERVYETVNNGVYTSGFARSQEAYEAAVLPLFATLDELEDRLSAQRYLAGERITEADWRLFVTLVRFDAVYHYHFKCNLRRLTDYPNLWGHTRELFRVPGVAETVNFDHIKRHYYMTHDAVNPTAIVPVGPELDFSAPHGREHLPATATAAT
jgi:putative glutathione S-transferase